MRYACMVWTVCEALFCSKYPVHVTDSYLTAPYVCACLLVTASNERASKKAGQVCCNAKGNGYIYYTVHLIHRPAG